MKPLLLKTLLARLEKAPGIGIWKNFFVFKEDGQEVDITQDGGVSCATFVGGMLISLADGLLKTPHAGVDGLEKDLINCGWHKIDFTEGEELKALEGHEGAIIMWGPRKGRDGILHRHPGFYLGNEMAISNDSRGTGVPHKHHYKYELEGPEYGPRPIESIYWHERLDKIAS